MDKKSNMEKYDELEMEILYFEREDVITESPTTESAHDDDGQSFGG